MSEQGSFDGGFVKRKPGPFLAIIMMIMRNFYRKLGEQRVKIMINVFS